MNEKTVTPKFLTRELAILAIQQVLGAVMSPSPIGTLLKRQACHIVILVPSMKDDRQANYPDWPNYSLAPHLLYEESVGKDEWTARYDEMARCKALQLWHDRNNDRSDVMPHLLFPGDTPYWGGIKRHGIVVACSGIQSWFDKMIAGMVAEVLIGLAYNAWMTSDDKKNRVEFLA